MPNEIQGLNNNRTNQQSLFKDVSKLETLNGAFKDGDTSPKQCRLKDISIHEAEKMFNEIDTDKNHKLLETLNGAFKDGDTSPKQCRLMDISIHEAEKMFNEIDTDKNHKLSWDEICDNRDKECKHLKRSNIVKAVLFGPFYTKKYVNNKYLIKECQRETQSYRERYDGTLEKKRGVYPVQKQMKK